MATPRSPRSPFAPRVGARLSEVAPGPDEAASDLALQDAHWRDAALAGERLEFAEVMGARLEHGDLHDTEWYRSSLVDVDADALDLANALFTESQWRRVLVQHSRLTGVSLAGCTIEDADLRHCVVNLANLRFARMRRVSFTDCQLTGTEFVSAELHDVTFTNCDLSEVQFSQARCQQVRLDNCRLDGVRGVDGLRGATIAPVDVLALTHQLAESLGIRVEELP